MLLGRLGREPPTCMTKYSQDHAHPRERKQNIQMSATAESNEGEAAHFPTLTIIVSSSPWSQHFLQKRSPTEQRLHSAPIPNLPHTLSQRQNEAAVAYFYIWAMHFVVETCRLLHMGGCFLRGEAALAPSLHHSPNRMQTSEGTWEVKVRGGSCRHAEDYRVHESGFHDWNKCNFLFPDREA